MSITTHQVNFRDDFSDSLGFISSDMLDDDIFKIILAEKNSGRAPGHFRKKDYKSF